MQLSKGSGMWEFLNSLQEHVLPVIEKTIQPLILAVVSIKMANVRALRVDLAVMNKNIQLLQKEVHSLVTEQEAENQKMLIRVEQLEDAAIEQKTFCKLKEMEHDLLNFKAHQAHKAKKQVEGN